jgi:3,4-dihydroxy-2-butanone 4-phosphate synthase
MLARAEAAVICPMLDGSGDLAATDHAMRVAARQGLRCVDAAELLLREPDAVA